MVLVYDVEPGKLIMEAAKRLEAMGLPRPHYLDFVKSGAHAERRPSQKNFWYLRCASIMRKAYIAPVGVNRLRVHYGGRKKRGVARERFVRASGSIIRRAFLALEKVGFLEKTKSGRRITPAGQKFLDGIARDILNESK